VTSHSPGPPRTLMHSVSGLRGIVGRDLTEEVVARYAAALGVWAREGEGGRERAREGEKGLVVIGRDSRESGESFAAAAADALLSIGCDVVDLGIVPTPTTQLAVEHHRAGAGLMISASHNPIEWNALKFLDPDGIYLDAEAGARVRAIAESVPAGTGRAPARRDAEGSIRRPSTAISTPCSGSIGWTSRRFGRGDFMSRSTACAAPAGASSPSCSIGWAVA
jgi:phosphomannomutase